MNESSNDFDAEVAQLFASPPPMPDVAAVAQRLEARAGRLHRRRAVAILAAIALALGAAVASLALADPAALAAVLEASLRQGIVDVLRLPILQPGPGGVDLFWLGLLLLLFPVLIAVMASTDA